MNSSISRISKLVAVIFALGLLLPALASARPNKRRPAVNKRAASVKRPARRVVTTKATSQKYKKVTRYGFKNDMVEATPDQGSGSLVTGSRRAGHSTLLKVRTNFLPELIKSALDL